MVTAGEIGLRRPQHRWNRSVDAAIAMFAVLAAVAGPLSVAAYAIHEAHARTHSARGSDGGATASRLVPTGGYHKVLAPGGPGPGHRHVDREANGPQHGR